MSMKQKQQFVAKLRRERGILVADLVKAQAIHDEIRQYRLTNLQSRLTEVNAKIKAASRG